MLTGTLIYSLFGGESRWVFVTGSFNDTVSFLLQCRIQKQETVRVRGIGKTNVGQGELQVAPCTPHLTTSPPLFANSDFFSGESFVVFYRKMQGFAEGVVC